MLDFEDTAIAYVCKKVAGINSDIRLLESIHDEAICFREDKERKIAVEDIRKFRLWNEPNVARYIEPFKPFLSVLDKSDCKTDFTIELRKELSRIGKQMLSTSDIIYALI